MNYSNYRGMNENKTNLENNAWDRWTKQDSKRDYRLVPEYENIVNKRHYQQYRPPSSNLYSRDS